MEYTIFKVTEFENNERYYFLIDCLIECLKYEKLTTFVPHMSLQWVIGNETQSVLKNLYNIILPYVKKITCQNHAEIIDVKILKHLKSPPDIKDGAFLWHCDNHPPNILNIIIYLSDVDEQGGALQYTTINGEIVKFPFRAPPGGAVYEEFFKENKDKIIVEQATGKKGAFFIFDNCILHRASHPKNKDRDALLLQVVLGGKNI